jgi:hypothetical protein
MCTTKTAGVEEAVVTQTSRSLVMCARSRVHALQYHHVPMGRLPGIIIVNSCRQ